MGSRGSHVLAGVVGAALGALGRHLVIRWATRTPAPVVPLRPRIPRPDWWMPGSPGETEAPGEPIPARVVGETTDPHSECVAGECYPWRSGQAFTPCLTSRLSGRFHTPPNPGLTYPQ